MPVRSRLTFWQLGGELLGGIALGVALPWTAIQLEGTRFFQSSEDYRPINAFAIGLLLFILAKSFHLNPFLAAFAGGMTVATCNPVVREAFEYLGQIITELLKLLTLLVFGALMSLKFLGHTTGWEMVFVVLVLILVRPIALGLALLGSRINKPEWIAAAWFGPKGFASVVYGMYLLKVGFQFGRQIVSSDRTGRRRFDCGPFLNGHSDRPLVSFRGRGTRGRGPSATRSTPTTGTGETGRRIPAKQRNESFVNSRRVIPRGAEVVRSGWRTRQVMLTPSPFARLRCRVRRRSCSPGSA